MHRCRPRSVLAASAALLLGAACSGPVTQDPDPQDSTPELPDSAESTIDGVNGRLESVDGRDLLYLWGSRYELGYAEGALMCGRLTRLFEDYILDYLVSRVGYDWDTITTIALAGIDIPDEVRSELEGVADGMRENCPAEDLIVTSDHLGLGPGGSREVELDDLLVANAVGDWACSSLTAWGSASASGHMLHARNFDYSIDPGGTFLDEHIVKVYDSTDEGIRFASVSVPGLVGCISCFAEDGTAFSMHNVTGLEAESTFGFVPRMLAMRQALAPTAGSSDPASDAEQVLEAAQQYRGNNLHLGWAATESRQAGAAVFEYDGAGDHEDGQATVRSPGSHQGSLQTTDAMVCTNHYLQRTEPDPSGDSVNRYDSVAEGVDAAVASGGLDATQAFTLMDAVSKSFTAHTTILDTSSMILQLWVAEAPGQSATDAEPVTLELGSLWD